jgi:hypothetical protein
MTARASIIRRLDAALEKMTAQAMTVRAIYLTADDWNDYNDAQSAAYGCPLVAFRYGPHEIRSGATSTIYSTHGVPVAIPKRVPDDDQAEAAA